MGMFAHSKARIFFVVCLAVAGWFIYVAVNGAIQNNRLEHERAVAQQELNLLRDKKTYVQAVKQYAASDAYIEQEARRRLGYIREGEIPFVVTSPPATDDTRSAGAWWERLFPR